MRVIDSPLVYIYPMLIARLEYALQCIAKAEPAEKKLRDGIKSKLVKASSRSQQIEQALKNSIITLDDVDILNAADAARMEAITVDEFTQESLARCGQSDAAKHTGRSDSGSKECA